MANKITDTQYYQSIANAIRTKNGTQNTYTPPQMAQAILDIPSGGADVYRFSIEDKVFGVGYQDVLNYGTHQVNILLKDQKNYLNVKKVRLRGKFVANSSHASRQCTGNLVLRKFVGSTPNDTNIGNISSGTSSSAQLSIDETIDVTSIDDLYIRISATSSYSNRTYPIDQYTWAGFGGQGTVIDGVPWYGLIVDYLFS